MTTGTAGFDGVIVFLRPSSAGSNPSGLRILATKDTWMNSGDPAPWNASPMTVPFPCPSGANTLLAAGVGGGNGSLTFDSVTDSKSNSWGSLNTAAVNDSYVKDYGVSGATIDQTLTVTLSVTFGGSDITPILYCIAGAKSSSAFDTAATNTGTTATTGATFGPTVSYTPAVAGELIFAHVGIAFNTANGLTGAGQVFHAGSASDEALSGGGVNQNNGWGSVLDATTGSQSFSWNLVSSSTAVQQWASAAVGVKPPASASVGCDKSNVCP